MIYAISPNIATAVGGRRVQLIGRDLDAASVAVTCGGGTAVSLFTQSRFLMNFTVPVHAVGAVNVVVTTTDGTATATNALTYI
jgi:hypothetical protein